MTELPAFEIHTYESFNAPPERAWIAHIWTEDAGVWPIHFSAPTEITVFDKATAFYEERRAKREETIMNRAEARRKADETRRRKAQDQDQ